MKPFMEAMREHAEIGTIETADDFYTTVHKTDLKRLIDMIAELEAALDGITEPWIADLIERTPEFPRSLAVAIRTAAIHSRKDNDSSNTQD